MISPLSTAGGLATTQTPGAVNSVKLLREGGRLLLEASSLPSRMPALQLGEEVVARVAEKLSDTRFLALIKNGLFTLDLPQGTKLGGESLTLRVAQLTPSLSFALIDAQPLDNPAETSAQVVLSRASQYLTSLLGAAERQPVQSGQLQPLQLDVSPDNPAEPAKGLQQAVTSSGVFYESHVKAWDDGRLALENLQQEPQAKLAQDTAMQNPARHADLGVLVQRQLDTLNNQQLNLQGLAWPGQPFQLEIQQEQVDEREVQSEQGVQMQWATRLRLQLPKLGEFEARLQLVGGQVRVQMFPHGEAATGLVEQHRQRLLQSMESAGLDLAQLVVNRDGQG